jgi:acetyl esterase
MMNRGKYAELIDEQTWAFIEETLAYYPEDTETRSIGEQREIYNTMCQQLKAERPSGVISHDYTMATATGSSDTIMLREYQQQGTQAAAQVLYFHGGGFVVGDLESHDDVCAEICVQTGFLVTSVDYRLTPEHVFPAAFDDGFASFQQVLERHDLPVILVGDSAGAHLVASVAHRSRALNVQAIGQLLIYPGLGGECTQGSYLEHADAPMLTTSGVVFYQEMMTGGDEFILEDPIFAPLNDSDFSGLPPTLVFTAQCDPLASDGAAYCEKIRAAGGVASCTEEAGLVHGYLRARHSAARAEDSFCRVVEGINEFVHTYQVTRLVT